MVLFDGRLKGDQPSREMEYEGSVLHMTLHSSWETDTLGPSVNERQISAGSVYNYAHIVDENGRRRASGRVGSSSMRSQMSVLHQRALITISFGCANALKTWLLGARVPGFYYLYEGLWKDSTHGPRLSREGLLSLAWACSKNRHLGGILGVCPAPSYDEALTVMRWFLRDPELVDAVNRSRSAVLVENVSALDDDWSAAAAERVAADLCRAKLNRNVTHAHFLSLAGGCR